jgi:predicted RNA-binding protein associated with RNAse of E/G family
MKRKFIDRSSWSRVDKSTSKTIYIENDEFKGYVYYILCEKVNSCLDVEMQGKKVHLVDDGYKWLQILPLDKRYSITTMIDDKDEIVQWYFDITKKNGIDEEGKIYYDDMYLDVVVLPSSEIILLDEDELEEALENNLISKADYDLAYSDAKEIMNGLARDVEKLKIFTTKFLQEIMLK